MDNGSAPRYLSSLPLKLQNRFVTYFPRKLFRFLHHKVQDKYCSHPLLLSKTLNGNTAPSLPTGYRFGRLGDAELQLIMTHREALPASVYQARLAKGDICYFLSVNDELVNFQWISTTRCGVFRGFDKGVDFLALAPHQAYTYDFYTYRNHRRLGYGTILKQLVLADLASRNISELLSCVMYDNVESLKIHMKLNYALKALPCNFRLMDWHWTSWGSTSQVNETRRWLESFTSNKHLSTGNQQT